VAPLQVAVSIPGRSQIVGHALRAGMAADPSSATSLVKWKSAFNTVRWNLMLATVEQRYRRPPSHGGLFLML
jgi:hypothetical protein